MTKAFWEVMRAMKNGGVAKKNKRALVLPVASEPELGSNSITLVSAPPKANAPELISNSVSVSVLPVASVRELGSSSISLVSAPPKANAPELISNSVSVSVLPVASVRELGSSSISLVSVEDDDISARYPSIIDTRGLSRSQRKNIPEPGRLTHDQKRKHRRVFKNRSNHRQGKKGKDVAGEYDEWV